MPKRILVVEDEDDNLTLFIHILQRLLGHTVFVAHDGHEAIQTAHAQKPELILMDLTLPKLTGWEATRSLRGSEEFRDTPILALTAHAMAGDRERAIEAGCNAYYTKPIDIDTFLKFLEPFLDEVPVAPPPAQPSRAAAPAEAPAPAVEASAPASPAPNGAASEAKPAATAEPAASASTEAQKVESPAPQPSEASSAAAPAQNQKPDAPSSSQEQPEASVKGEAV
jgi:two-component system, cell cycle response regulator DivK